jgi:hypothetical protein
VSRDPERRRHNARKASRRGRNGPIGDPFARTAPKELPAPLLVLARPACETAGNRPLALEIVLGVASGLAMAALVGAGLAPCNSPVVIQTVRI